MAKLRGNMKLVLSRETVRRFFAEEFFSSYSDVQGELISVQCNGSDNAHFLTLTIVDHPQKEVTSG